MDVLSIRSICQVAQKHYPFSKLNIEASAERLKNEGREMTFLKTPLY